MAKFDELSVLARAGIILVVVVLVCVGVYYGFLSDIKLKNDALETQIAAKEKENAQLHELEPKLIDINKQIDNLQQQIANEKLIVPEDKDPDQFIKVLHDTASAAGIKIRRYTAVPGANHEFYGEVPFAIDIDGPYYQILNFFERVARLERIVNVSNMQMSTIKNTAPSRVRTAYTFDPNATVAASCTATTFYSHDQQVETPAAGAPAAAKR
jgi:type IV pilus assembly protein PilO